MDEDFITEHEDYLDQKIQSEAKIFQKVYLGPTLPKRGIICGTVYLNGLPFNVKEAVKDIPVIENLIVPVSECEITRRKIREKGTPENIFYERISKEGAK